MHITDFPQSNLRLAEDQPEYQTLFVHVAEEIAGIPYYFRFGLDDHEIAEIIRTKAVWGSQLTFGKKFNPMFLYSSSPFEPELQPQESYLDALSQQLPEEVFNALHNFAAALQGAKPGRQASDVAFNLCHYVIGLLRRNNVTNIKP